MKKLFPIDASCEVIVFRLIAFMFCVFQALGGNLCVEIRDPSGEPLQAVSVMITKQKETAATIPFEVTQTRTDASGNACFFAIPDGSYDVELTMQGFLTTTYHSVRVDILRPKVLRTQLLFGQVNELDISRIARISGVLRFRNEPDVEARICAYESDSGLLVNCSRTDRFGQFGLLIEPGSYLIKVTRNGGLYLNKSVVIPNAGTFRDLIPSELSRL